MDISEIMSRLDDIEAKIDTLIERKQEEAKKGDNK
jgi:tetrahydromethanopterin S-methyltransferase subunit G